METNMKVVTIVGCGAIGSHVTMLLRNVDARLKVVDFDRLAAKNVLSQFHAKGTVGQNKAIALQGTMRLVFGVPNVVAVPSKVTHENAAVVFAGSALVIDAVDNATARHAVSLGAQKAGCPCLHVGLAADGAYGLVLWDEAFRIDDAPPGAATCEDGEHVAFCALVAARAAMAAQRYLETGERRGYAVSPAHAASL